MFKKLKDKLAEEVKSSPQRIQSFAQAAQAAVTSASSSISDITNSDLFSIGDNDNQQAKGRQLPVSAQNTFQEVSHGQPALQQSPADVMDYTSTMHDSASQRQRRLSNSSFASDVSFRLPSYDTPSMYHLQSDMEISASEAEERGFSAGTVSLERVTKEQLYAAYRRTQDRYTKYRTQYGDLARHYKLLERENAKARSVLVETQDKALRRISELKEQCALEQSAKAHLEKALRVDLEEKNMKIEALTTKIKLLQSTAPTYDSETKNDNENIYTTNSLKENEAQLINLNDNETQQTNEDIKTDSEITALNIRIEKMEQLMNKYKESLKLTKEKNCQITTELQIVTNELENKNKEIKQLQATSYHLDEANRKIQELNLMNEELQNKVNTYDFNKTKELSVVKLDLEKANEEINQLRSKIEVFTKREEEYAISLAENKLSIHKELESKEAEIKSLKDSLSVSKQEIQSLGIVIQEYKNSASLFEEERLKFNKENKELGVTISKIKELELQIQELTKNCASLEQIRTKTEEEYKCLQLQIKQETAEKLAMIDRNVYLENRNTQLNDENSKKSSQINTLEHELQSYKKNKDDGLIKENLERNEFIVELNTWKTKYRNLESEIQEEREELVKLQSEIEKLLANQELLHKQNCEYHNAMSQLKSENFKLQDEMLKFNIMKDNCKNLAAEINGVQHTIRETSQKIILLKQIYSEMIPNVIEKINIAIQTFSEVEIKSIEDKYQNLEADYSRLRTELLKQNEQCSILSQELNLLQDENNVMKAAIAIHESDKEAVNKNTKTIVDQNKASLDELCLLKKENQEIKLKIQETDNIYRNLQAATELEKSKHLAILDQVKLLENERKQFKEKIKHINDENKSLATDLEKLNDQYTAIMDDYNSLKNENNELVNKTADYNEKRSYIHKLEESNNIMLKENDELRNQAKSIASHVSGLESEIKDVRKAHAEIEKQKNQLCETIKHLEISVSENKFSNVSKDVDTQTQEDFRTESITANTLCAKETQTNDEFDIENATHAHGFQNEHSEEYNSLKNDFDLLKEENRRLQSDIEGLQSYLTKISKENSVLNDKLRELIATSEHTSENGNNSHDLTNFKNEFEAGKDRIDELLRENTILIEENLELKDQLHSQNYTSNTENKPSNNNQTELETTFKAKYNNLLNVNTNLDRRLSELEQINKSVNGNMEQMQDKNEKLRLLNEKLERRLDEALVSLRHLHSLQENTELEYLKNILYEYLTGSGTHSITLAKVLSAVVKFDDMQTQMVLQKEKERQGLLRQLGLL